MATVYDVQCALSFPPEYNQGAALGSGLWAPRLNTMIVAETSFSF